MVVRLVLLATLVSVGCSSVEPMGEPTVGSALLRLIASLPALLILAMMSMVGAALWIVGALSILIAERVPAPIRAFLSMKLRYQFRVVAYHLSLVDAYPIADAPGPHSAHPGVV
jgi:hypothetical protein